MLREPGDRGPEEAAEILDGEGQGQRARNDAEVPQDRHGQRDEGPVEQRGEHEALGAHPATHHVQHAHATHEQAEEPEVMVALLTEGGKIEYPCHDLRGEQDQATLDEDEPAEDLHGLGRAALPFRPQQSPERVPQCAHGSSLSRPESPSRQGEAGSTLLRTGTCCSAPAP